MASIRVEFRGFKKWIAALLVGVFGLLTAVHSPTDTVPCMGTDASSVGRTPTAPSPDVQSAPSCARPPIVLHVPLGARRRRATLHAPGSIPCPPARGADVLPTATEPRRRNEVELDRPASGKCPYEESAPVQLPHDAHGCSEQPGALRSTGGEPCSKGAR